MSVWNSVGWIPMFRSIKTSQPDLELVGIDIIGLDIISRSCIDIYIWLYIIWGFGHPCRLDDLQHHPAWQSGTPQKWLKMKVYGCLWCIRSLILFALGHLVALNTWQAPRPSQRHPQRWSDSAADRWPPRHGACVLGRARNPRRRGQSAWNILMLRLT